MVKYIYTIKQYLFFVLSFLAFNTLTEAQYLITDTQKTVYENDSVVLYVNNIRGHVQWQVSEDKILWENIDGKTNASLSIYVDSSAFYRAMITEGTCEPVYSDPVLIAQVYDERDNQFYNAVKMGLQWWMAQNLDYSLKEGSWYYNNDSINHAEKYGRLYNWQSAKTVCPAGWHLPSDLEWKLLEMDLGMSKSEADTIEWRGTDQGIKLQESGTYHFNAELGGFRLANGTFNYLESSGTFWTSSEYDISSAWYRGIGTDPDIHRYYYDKDMGFSVRCIRNDPPVVNTDSVFDITTYSATGTGEIIVNGGAPVISRGFCWSNSPSPDLTDNFTSQAGGLGTFKLKITGLNKNTTYYLRAFATNGFGTNYGKNLVFKTPAISPPSVSTDQAYSITQTSAVLGGFVQDDGGSAVIIKGLCWDTLASPDYTDNVILKGAGMGGFSETVSGLKINHEYHVRAFAVNNIDTAYGEEMVFETLPVNPVDTFTDPRDGQTYEIIKIGYQWWLADNLDHFMPYGSWYYNDDSISYSSEYGRLYNWETALAACPTGWHLPADDEWKILEQEVGMSESEADNNGWRGTNQGDMLKKGAPVGLDVLFGGFRNENSVYNYIGSSGTYWSATSFSTENAWYRGFGPEPNIHRDYFNKSMGFSVRCVRDNTPIIEAMIFKDSTTRVSAVFLAEVLYDGGDAVSSRGICWGTLPNPEISGNKIIAGNGTVAFTVKITGLIPNNTYHARAFAINKFDTAYSDNITFISVARPTISTGNVVNVTSTSATSGGTITDDGGTGILARGVCWNISSKPTVLNSKTSNGSGIGSYVSSISGLQPNVVYYLRAYAITAYDTVYGNEKILKTLPTGQTETITDSRDGKSYDIINIGDQWWFAENLNFQTLSSYCYENNPAYCDTFGRLYKWDVSLNSCPFGWHLPRDEEFKVLERYLGMDSLDAEEMGWRGTDQGTQLKEGSPLGYNIKYGGFRQEDGEFVYINSSGTFWTSTEQSVQNAWYRGFGPIENNIHRYTFDKDMSFSVRCIKTNSPEIVTDSVYNVTKTSARIDSKVLSDGGEDVTQRGVCYSQSHGPTIFNNKVTAGDGIGAFSVQISGLTVNRTYYARAYAINNYDTAYSNELSFLTVIKPTVFTSPATSVTKSSAIVGGVVSDDGGSTILERGVCYSTSPNPVYTDNILVIGSGSGIFSSNLSGLGPNKNYYIRAYALNKKDTAFGNELQFRTLPVFTTGTMTDGRDGKIYNKIKIGEQWWLAENLNYSSSNSWCYENTTANCDTLGHLYQYSAALNACPSHWHLPSDIEWQTLETELGMINANSSGWRGSDQGTQLKYEGSSGFNVLMGGFRSPGSDFEEIFGSGTFWTSTSESTENAWYRGFGFTEPTIHRDAYNKNYGFSVRCLKDTLPVVITSPIISFTDSSVTGGGEVLYDGGRYVTSRGICIGTTSNPTIANDTTNNGTGLGQFTSYKKGLQPGTAYYVRAYATNIEGTSYGSQIIFTTGIAKPQVTTGTISDTTMTTATVLGNNVLSDGGSPITHKGVCWSESINPLITDNVTDNGTGTGTYNSLLTDLTRNTLYYVRAYATNDAGTSYGDNVSFRTKADLPAVNTATVTSVTHNTAQSGGTITDDGGISITHKGVCWNTTGSPTVSDSHTDEGTGSGAFTSSITGLSANTTYYVKAYAQNSAGITYGNQLFFTTPHETGLLTDTRDNQEYLTVKIGVDWWMAENLNYRDTGSVYYVNDSIQWADIYGRLYTWTSMMKGAASSSVNPSGVQGVCPSGWHVPSNAEWNVLISGLGGASVAGGKLKETGTAHWVPQNNYATNESGFTARPAGMVDAGLNSSNKGSDAYFWTTTESDGLNAYIIRLVENSAGVTNPSQSKTNHYSVRCKKN
jgi:uncharacterized protein (TIGR02145 family)